MLQKILCHFGMHKKLRLVCSLSSQSDLIACPDCKRRYAINYGVRIVLPWDRELENLYEEMDFFNRETNPRRTVSGNEKEK